MLTFLRDLLAHSEWANAVFFHVWGKSPARDHEELRRRVGPHDRSAARFLVGAPRRATGRTSSRAAADFENLKTRRNEPCGAAQFRGCSGRRGSGGTVRIPWFPEPPCIITISEALVQVAMHTQHHRGQCMTRLKDFGGEPKNVDWIIWLWTQKPQGRWN